MFDECELFQVKSNKFKSSAVHNFRKREKTQKYRKYGWRFSLALKSSYFYKRGFFGFWSMIHRHSVFFSKILNYPKDMKCSKLLLVNTQILNNIRVLTFFEAKSIGQKRKQGQYFSQKNFNTQRETASAHLLLLTFIDNLFVRTSKPSNVKFTQSIYIRYL